MEKRRPHYDLESIKVAFSSEHTLRITVSARSSVRALGLTLADVVILVQGMSRSQFYKSMTSHASSAIWQDVYHVSHGNLVLYVKFTADTAGYYLLISCKER